MLPLRLYRLLIISAVTEIDSDSESAYSDDGGSDEESIQTDQTPALTPLTPVSPSRGGRAKRYACPYESCTAAFARPGRLTEHIRTHTNERPFACSHPDCTKTFLRDTHLKRHIRSAHSSERKFVCDWPGCDKKFVNGTRLRRHIKAHEDSEQYRCTAYPPCNARFYKRETLRTHVESVHLGRKPFPCTHVDETSGEQCALAYDTAQKLREHEQRVHGGARYFCHICTEEKAAAGDGEDGGEEVEEPVGFRTYNELQHHTRVAHPPVCPHCALVCISQHQLNQHIEVNHNSLDIDARRVFTCDFPGCHGVASHGFTRRGNLRVHVQTVHSTVKQFVCGGFDLSTSDKTVYADGSRWDGANACNRGCGSKASLEDHVRTQHMGLERWQKAKQKANQDTAEVVPPVKETSRKKSARPADLSRLTGHGYAESGRNIACLVSTCHHRFFRDFDLETHLRSAHGCADVEIIERLAERDALSGGPFWVGGVDVGEAEAQRVLDTERGIEELGGVDVRTGQVWESAVPVDPALYAAGNGRQEGDMLDAVRTYLAEAVE